MLVGSLPEAQHRAIHRRQEADAIVVVDVDAWRGPTSCFPLGIARDLSTSSTLEAGATLRLSTPLHRLYSKLHH